MIHLNRTKSIAFFKLLILFLFPVSTLVGENKVTEPEKMQWWLDNKFGMFIHWGPSSVAGTEISWSRQTHPFDHPGKLDKIPDHIYDALYKKFKNNLSLVNYHKLLTQSIY